MRKVLLIDTSLLCVWLQVPGRETAGNNEGDFERVNQKIQAEIDTLTTLVLPLAAVIETGNHIAQAKTANSETKRIAAHKFAEIITYSASGYYAIQFFSLPFPIKAFRFEDVPHSCRKCCIEQLITDYPKYLLNESARIIDPAISAIALTLARINFTHNSDGFNQIMV
ncbi:MAG TPA: hypothetical protein VE944_17685 [Nostoc sp.]|uniref:hypothetical protein n=1 Tax=Nostoc sp. TaxID=1180 RepID=UPI002D380D75|nr:hypothetical protein [Nostoc sp.]HYX16161.1 hypothetical protein [Nostoc sp.]